MHRRRRPLVVLAAEAPASRRATPPPRRRRRSTPPPTARPRAADRQPGALALPRASAARTAAPSAAPSGAGCASAGARIFGGSERRDVRASCVSRAEGGGGRERADSRPRRPSAVPTSIGFAARRHGRLLERLNQRRLRLREAPSGSSRPSTKTAALNATSHGRRRRGARRTQSPQRTPGSGRPGPPTVAAATPSSSSSPSSSPSAARPSAAAGRPRRRAQRASPPSSSHITPEIRFGITGRGARASRSRSPRRLTFAQPVRRTSRTEEARRRRGRRRQVLDDGLADSRDERRVVASSICRSGTLCQPPTLLTRALASRWERSTRCARAPPPTTRRPKALSRCDLPPRAAAARGCVVHQRLRPRRGERARRVVAGGALAAAPPPSGASEVPMASSSQDADGARSGSTK